MIGNIVCPECHTKQKEHHFLGWLEMYERALVDELYTCHKCGEKLNFSITLHKNTGEGR